MLSLNIFPPARIQIGILIRKHLNIPLGDIQTARGLRAVSCCFLLPPPVRTRLELHLHKSNKGSQNLYRSYCSLTEQMFQIPLVVAVWVVEKAPFSAHKVEGVHQVRAAQVPGGGRRSAVRAEHQQQQQYGCTP